MRSISVSPPVCRRRRCSIFGPNLLNYFIFTHTPGPAKAKNVTNHVFSRLATDASRTTERRVINGESSFSIRSIRLMCA